MHLQTCREDQHSRDHRNYKSGIGNSKFVAQARLDYIFEVFYLLVERRTLSGSNKKTLITRDLRCTPNRNSAIILLSICSTLVVYIYFALAVLCLCLSLVIPRVPMSSATTIPTAVV